MKTSKTVLACRVLTGMLSLCLAGTVVAEIGSSSATDLRLVSDLPQPTLARPGLAATSTARVQPPSATPSTLVIVTDEARPLPAVAKTPADQPIAPESDTTGSLLMVIDPLVEPTAAEEPASILQPSPEPIVVGSPATVMETPLPVVSSPAADAYRCKSLFGSQGPLDDLGLMQLTVDTRATVTKLEELEEPAGYATSEDLPPSPAAKRLGLYANATPVGDGCFRWDYGHGFYWAAPSFFHRPLYFEQVGAERYGHYLHSDCVQSVVSSAHFFGDALLLPYKLAAAPHHCVDYTLGRYRPGNCNPKQPMLEPISRRGVVVQAATVTGLVFLIP